MGKAGAVAAWVGLSCGVLAVFAMVLAAPGYRWSWWDLGVVFNGLFKVATYGGIAAVVFGLIATVLRMLGRADRIWPGVLGILLGVMAAVVPLGMRYKVAQVPMIHDITTSVVDPPEFHAVVPLREGASNPPDYDPAVGALQREAYPDISTIRVREPTEEVLAAATDVVSELGWELVASDAEAGRIEATETTRWFGFKDDIVIRIRKAGGVTEVDVRSKSRVGRSDLGVNAERIRTFRNLLLTRLTAR